MEEAKMFEAKSLLDKLNEKCAEMQEQYDQMESTNSYDAKVLKSDIDAMNEAIIPTLKPLFLRQFAREAVT